MKNHIYWLSAAGLLCLTGCASAPNIQALSGDPATLSIHQQITTPWGVAITDVTRVNSTNTAATANSAGAAVNVPNGATVNPAPVKPVGAVTLTPGTPGTAPGP